MKSNEPIPGILDSDRIRTLEAKAAERVTELAQARDTIRQRDAELADLREQLAASQARVAELEKQRDVIEPTPPRDEQFNDEFFDEMVRQGSPDPRRRISNVTKVYPMGQDAPPRDESVPAWLTSLYVDESRGQYVLADEARDVLNDECDNMRDPDLTVAHWMRWRERLAGAFGLAEHAHAPDHSAFVALAERWRSRAADKRLCDASDFRWLTCARELLALCKSAPAQTSEAAPAAQQTTTPTGGSPSVRSHDRVLSGVVEEDASARDTAPATSSGAAEDQPQPACPPKGYAGKCEDCGRLLVADNVDRIGWFCRRPEHGGTGCLPRSERAPLAEQAAIFHRRWHYTGTANVLESVRYVPADVLLAWLRALLREPAPNVAKALDVSEVLRHLKSARNHNDADWKDRYIDQAITALTSGDTGGAT